MGKFRVTVVYAGRSWEHALSCATAGSVMAAIGDRYEVVPIGIARDGRWVLASGQSLAIESGELPEVAGDALPLALPFDPESRALMGIGPGRAPRAPGAVHVVRRRLHGPSGR